MKKRFPSLVLASTSPRRRQILGKLEIPFQVVSPAYEEKSALDLSPSEEALHFSREKARSVAPQFPGHWIIGSDTLIEFRGEKIGKPRDFEHAFEILRKLRGRQHQIHTGIALIYPQSCIEKVSLETAQVKMRHYSDEEIRDYVLREQPFDKAGAYAIQGGGRQLIEEFEGDYFAIVGFPLKRFVDLWMEEGCSRKLLPAKFQLKIRTNCDKIYSSIQKRDPA